MRASSNWLGFQVFGCLLSAISVISQTEEAWTSVADPMTATADLTITSAVTCDFEDGLCGWRSVPDTGYAFHLGQGTTRDSTSGPRADHTREATTVNGTGHYVYASGWEGSGPTEEARLRSPVLQLPRPSKLYFWYHMNGQGVGNLSVYLAQRHPDPSSTFDLVWEVTGRQGGEWRRGEVDLFPGYWQIEFKSTAKHAYGSDVALDDLVIVPDYLVTATPTPTPRQGVYGVSCSFETQDLCGYRQVLVTDNLDWTWQSGSTPSEGTGPDADHTYGTEQGHYLFVESSSPAFFKDTALLESPPVAVTWPTWASCLRFWYSMYGVGTGSLAVNVNGLDFAQPGEVTDTGGVTEASVVDSMQTQVWNMSGDQGSGWHEAAVTINTSLPVKVVFEAIISSSDPTYLGDMAIDDVTVSHGPCPDSSCTRHLSCPFDENTCGFQGSSDWVLETTRPQESRFRFQNERSDSTDLRSPPLCNGEMTVRFRSQITSDAHAELTVLTECEHDDLLGQPSLGFRGPLPAWGLFNFTLPACPDGQEQRVVFRAVKATPASVVLLDDVYVNVYS